MASLPPVKGATAEAPSPAPGDKPPLAPAPSSLDLAATADKLTAAAEDGSALAKLAALLREEPSLDGAVLGDLLFGGEVVKTERKRAPLWRRSDCGAQLRLSRSMRNGLGDVHAAAAQAAGDPLGGVLLCHCMVGDADAVYKIRELLDAGVSPNCSDATGLTGLHLAAEYAEPWLIEELTKHADTDVNAADTNGVTPLSTAAQWGRIKCLDALLQKGADVTSTGGFARDPHGRKLGWVSEPSGWTPLHFAADFGMQTLDVMKKLVDAKAPLNARDYSGCAPLHIAARRGYPRAVKILLEGGCDVAVEDERSWRALHFACSTGHVEVARILIDKGADANALTMRGYTPLWLAENFNPEAAGDSWDALRELLGSHGGTLGDEHREADTARTAAAVKVELDEAYKEAEAEEAEQGDTFDAKLKTSYVKDVIAARAKYGTPTFVNGKRMA